jgi:hypothetical protein
MPTDVTISAWTRIVDYPHNHLNDFCIFRGLDNRWHAIGIMGTGTWESEVELFHCSCGTLQGRYDIHPPILKDVKQGNTVNVRPGVHCPFVVVHEGVYHLYFRRPWGTNLHVTSTDTFVWTLEPELVFEERDARDACIPRFDGVWHWYYVQRYTAADGVDHSAVMVRTSRDLKVWSDAKPAYVDYRHVVKHSRLESPAICRKGDTFWLLVRDRKRETPQTPAPTVVYASKDPCFFDSTRDPLAIFADMHAPEIVEHEGRHYVVRVSGVTHASLSGVNDHGWLEVAELTIPNDPGAECQPAAAEGVKL